MSAQKHPRVCPGCGSKDFFIRRTYVNVEEFRNGCSLGGGKKYARIAEVVFLCANDDCNYEKEL